MHVPSLFGFPLALSHDRRGGDWAIVGLFVHRNLAGAFLAPLPVRELWGVGPKMSARLVELGVTTIGELARKPEAWMVKQFGKWGFEMAQHARGIDDRPIELLREKTVHVLSSLDDLLRQFGCQLDPIAPSA